VARRALAVSEEAVLMRKAIVLFGLVLLASFPAAAQGLPKFELFGGYTYTRVDGSDGTTANANGGTVDVGFFPVKHWGVIANFGGDHEKGFRHSDYFYSAPSTSFHYLFGPRYRVSAGPLSAYLQVLVGDESRSSIVDSNPADSDFLPCGTCSIPPAFTFAPAQTTWAIGPSAGVDIRLNRRLSIRAVQVGGLVTGFKDLGTGGSAVQGGVSISMGVVVHM
jgi:hypothetical protein